MTEAQIQSINADCSIITIGDLSYPVIEAWARRLRTVRTPLIVGDWIDYLEEDGTIVSLHRILGPSDKSFTPASNLPKQPAAASGDDRQQPAGGESISTLAPTPPTQQIQPPAQPTQLPTQQAVTLPDLDQDKIALIKQTVARGCTNNEFALLMHLASCYGLDPLKREIWAVKYGTAPAQIFAGRDGYLAIAHRSGQFDGMESGIRTDEAGEMIGWCRVYRKDMSHPFSVEVYRVEYDTKKSLWLTKPRVMIQKVAESQCLRRAFSIAGLYSPEEIQQEG